MSTKKSGPFLIGIDVGTTGCKTELFDEDANSIAKSYQDYPILVPKVGWAEEDPEAWWKAVTDTIRNVLRASKIDSSFIAGIAVSCTNACVPVDKGGKTLRNAIMQIDQRTVPQAAWIRQQVGEERVFEVTGNRVAPGSFSAPIILWIKGHEPRTFDRIHKFLVPTGFIVQRLTGEFTMDWSRGATTLLFKIREREWSEELCSEMGIPLEKLPKTLPPWEIAGEVSEKAARHTGLKGGTPVVAGSMDTVAAAIGSGAIGGGDTFCVLGSVARVCASLDNPLFDKRFLNTCHAIPNAWLAIGCINGAGLSLKWFVDNFGQREVDSAKKTGVTPYQILDAEAEKSPPGAKGIIYLPYIAAERSPIWDPDAKGVIFGLTIHHNRCDTIRALLEGVAYAIRHNLETLEIGLKEETERIRISGGGAKSKLWQQTIANVCGKSLIPTALLETEPLGDALIAGTSVGIYKNLEEATSHVLIGESVKPRKEYYGKYSQLFVFYKKLYEHLRGDFKHLSRIRHL